MKRLLALTLIISLPAAHRAVGADVPKVVFQELTTWSNAPPSIQFGDASNGLKISASCSRHDLDFIEGTAFSVSVGIYNVSNEAKTLRILPDDIELSFQNESGRDIPVSRKPTTSASEGELKPGEYTQLGFYGFVIGDDCDSQHSIKLQASAGTLVAVRARLKPSAAVSKAFHFKVIDKWKVPYRVAGSVNPWMRAAGAWEMATGVRMRLSTGYQQSNWKNATARHKLRLEFLWKGQPWQPPLRYSETWAGSAWYGGTRSRIPHGTASRIYWEPREPVIWLASGPQPKINMIGSPKPNPPQQSLEFLRRIRFADPHRIEQLWVGPTQSPTTPSPLDSYKGRAITWDDVPKVIRDAIEKDFPKHGLSNPGQLPNVVAQINYPILISQKVMTDTDVSLRTSGHSSRWQTRTPDSNRRISVFFRANANSWSQGFKVLMKDNPAATEDVIHEFSASEFQKLLRMKEDSQRATKLPGTATLEGTFLDVHNYAVISGTRSDSDGILVGVIPVSELDHGLVVLTDVASGKFRITGIPAGKPLKLVADFRECDPPANNGSYPETLSAMIEPLAAGETKRVKVMVEFSPSSMWFVGKAHGIRISDHDVEQPKAVTP